jgi:hypothetical protein
MYMRKTKAMTEKIIEMKTAEEFLNDKFDGKGYEFKIHDWINGQVSNYSPCELLEEYAQQNTLNRDKVMEILRKIKIVMN